MSLVLLGLVPRVAAGASFTPLGDLAGERFQSGARGVSSDGSVVVGWSDSVGNRSEAFRWTSGSGMVGLGQLADYSTAFGVSADGSVVVGNGISGNGLEAFQWTSDSGWVGLGDLAGGYFESTAYGVSADGSVVVGMSSTDYGQWTEAFRWTADGGMVSLGRLSPDYVLGSAYGVSADGSVVVGGVATGNGYQQEAFIWDETNGTRLLKQVLTDLGLDLTGWTLVEAMGVSADGLTIVGDGTNPSGFYEAWVATIPEPGTGLLVMTGVMGLAGWRRLRA